MRARLGIFAIVSVSALAAVVGLAAQGCTVLTNDAPPDDAGPYEAGDTGTGAAATCEACVLGQCTGLWAACLDDADCRAARACEAKDGGASCVCGAAGGGTFAAFAACNDAKTCATVCQVTSCTATCAAGAPHTTPAACATPDAGEIDASVPDSSADAGDGGDEGGVAPVVVSVDSCSSCVSNNCGDPLHLCAGGTECEAYLLCVEAADDEPAAAACATAHATGQDAAKQVSVCVKASCLAECGL